MRRKHCILTWQTAVAATVFVLLLCCPCAAVLAQYELKGVVTDAATQKTLPFATVKACNTNNGTVTDLNGNYTLSLPANANCIEISYIGYTTQILHLSHTGEWNIALQPGGNDLKEVVIKPPYEKIRRILNSAVASRSRNNPELYDWYRCHVYYKIICR